MDRTKGLGCEQRGRKWFVISCCYFIQTTLQPVATHQAPNPKLPSSPLQALHARRQAGAGASSSGDAAAAPSAFSAVELVELAEGGSSSGAGSMGSVGEAGMSVWWGRLAPEERMGVSNLAAADDLALPTTEADREASRRGV